MDAYTVTATFGGTTVKITLYGPVSEERATQEQAIAEHRANQLSVVPQTYRK